MYNYQSTSPVDVYSVLFSTYKIFCSSINIVNINKMSILYINLLKNIIDQQMGIPQTVFPQSNSLQTNVPKSVQQMQVQFFFLFFPTIYIQNLMFLRIFQRLLEDTPEIFVLRKSTQESGYQSLRFSAWQLSSSCVS